MRLALGLLVAFVAGTALGLLYDSIARTIALIEEADL